MWSHQTYRIRVSGVLSPDWSDWFDGLTIRIQHSDSLIEGEFPNQAALLGVLNRLNALSLTVLSVERIQSEGTENQNLI